MGNSGKLSVLGNSSKCLVNRSECLDNITQCLGDNIKCLSNKRQCLDNKSDCLGNRRTASVKSVGYSDLFVLSKKDMWDVLKERIQMC